MKVYNVVEENSPELIESGCPSFEIKACFDSFAKAVDYVKNVELPELEQDDFYKVKGSEIDLEIDDNNSIVVYKNNGEDTIDDVDCIEEWIIVSIIDMEVM